MATEMVDPTGMTLGEISVRGVLQSRGTLVAMIQGPDNRTYIVHQGDTDVLLSRINSAGVRLRQIGTWDNLHTAAFPKSYGRGQRTAKMAHIEPQEEAASRALVAETRAQNLVANVEFGPIGLPYDADVLLLAPNGD